MDISYTTEEEVLTKARQAVGIPFGRFDTTGRLSVGSNKGGIGQVLEEGHFGYKPNSDSEPDFKEAGVELKATPYRRNRDGSISAKERLVLNIIDYMTEHSCSFEESSFWHKNAVILLMLYEHLEDTAKADLSVSHTFLYKYPSDDLAIIRADWMKISGKISDGLAHELSESDTMYLAACTKGATAESSLREQPFSDKKAKQRAFSFKGSYMTGLLRRFIFGDEQDERIIKDVSELQDKGFEEIVTARLQPHFGRRRSDLLKEFSLNGKSKSANERIIAGILGIKCKVSQSSEFLMAVIIPKTIHLESNGNIKESMSFKAFRPLDIIQQEWEESDLCELFETSRFMFILFRKSIDGDSVFEGIRFWNMPRHDLDEVEKVWKRTVRTIREGVVFTATPRGSSNNLPKASENKVAHVRPHGRDKDDTVELPDGSTITKQCFWLNNSYLRSVLTYSVSKNQI